MAGVRTAALPLHSLHVVCGEAPHGHYRDSRVCRLTAIARALAVEPELLVLDEPTNAFDISVQKQVLGLLTRSQKISQTIYGLSFMLITHALAVIRALAHCVVFMKSGCIVESGETLDLSRAPSHPYTQTPLAASMPPSYAHPQHPARTKQT